MVNCNLLHFFIFPTPKLSPAMFELNGFKQHSKEYVWSKEDEMKLKGNQLYSNSLCRKYSKDCKQ